MRLWLFCSLIFVFAATTASQAALKADSINYSGFGKLYLYKPEQEVKNVVICISDDEGWNEGVENIALKIKDPTTLIIGVNMKRYLHYLNEEKESCLYPAAEFEQMSQFVQKELHYQTYVIPILMGYSSGATLAYGMLAQAPQNTFRGAIVFGFCSSLDIKKPLCHGSGNLECVKRTDEKGYNLSAVSTLTAPFIAMQGAADKVCDYAAAVAFLKHVPKAEIVSLPKVGHAYTAEKKWVPQFKQAYAHLLSITTEKPVPDMANLKINLPIQITEPARNTESNEMMLMISGDGGWTGFDQQVASEFAQKGIPVVGLNALKYFWSKKTPEQTSHDVLDLIAKYDAIWKKQDIILLGYSFGADVMPFIYNRLPEAIRKRVKSVALLSPSKDTDFEVHVSDLLNFGSSTREFNVPAEITKIKDVHLVCFFGKDEENIPINELSKGNCRVIMLEGGHHYDNSFDIIYNVVMP